MREKEVIGGAVLYLGDCFDILPEISGADAVISDPPYACTQNDWDKEVDWPRFWNLSKKFARPCAPFILFCQMPFSARLYNSNPENFRYDLVYPKPVITGFLDARKKPLRAHENIYVFCEKRPEYRPQMKKSAPYIKKSKVDSKNYGRFYPQKTINSNGDRFPTTILDVKHENTFYTVKPEHKRHPTQKSVAALSDLIKTYSDPENIILDPFMGSGSTGVAAIRHGRKFIGIEKEREWFDVACERIEKERQAGGLLREIERGKEGGAMEQMELI